MNKSALKTFATSARKELLKKIEAKAMKIGITEDNIKKADIESSDAIFIDGKQLSKEEKIQRDKLITRINQIGFKQVMEEVAYTWFNRFTALRYMEVNDYLPTGVRVLSSSNPNSADPDMLNEALELDLEVELDKEHIYNLKLNNETEELFKYLIIKHCNDLNRFLPFMFETIDDYTEVLFPEGLLAKDSFIRQMTDTKIISEDDWQKVEIIGWLYQYYISEEKDKVFANLKKNIKITKETLPAATQLFTPHWIVRYMVENSLGRIWIDSYPDSSLKYTWKHYMEEVEQEEEVMKYLNELRYSNVNPEEITFLDPCCGSGHILVYAFDVFYDMYIEKGYIESEIPKLILEKNLFGLDVDDRAVQLASFAVMMKAREKSRRVFRQEIHLNISAIQESNWITEEVIELLIDKSETPEIQSDKRNIIESIRDTFKDAKEYGSILNIEPNDMNFLELRLEQLATETTDLFQMLNLDETKEKLPGILKQAKILSQHYDIVCTNPPYMGSNGMDSELIALLKTKYPNTKSDLSTVFMEKALTLCKPNGMISMLNIPVWMFLSSYEKLRSHLISNKTIINMLHFGRGVFGSDFGTTAFVISNHDIKNYSATYRRLFEQQGAVDSLEQKEKWFFENKGTYIINKERFLKIPSFPIAYWASDRALEIFQNEKNLADYYPPKQGMATADNKRFIRHWTEVSINKISFDLSSADELDNDTVWVPYNKGGDFRKWYGNQEYVVFWKNNGEDIKNYIISRYPYLNGNYSFVIKNETSYFQDGITWSRISSSYFGVRYLPKGFIFDANGSMLFPNKELQLYLLGFLCSSIANYFIRIINPTMAIQTGSVSQIPIIIPDEEKIYQIDELVKDLKDYAKEEWDENEISWNFSKHPLLKCKSNVNKINEVIVRYDRYVLERSNNVIDKEHKLDSLFKEIYGMDNEIALVEDDESLTVNNSSSMDLIKTFIAYAVGCIFGRYSLDENGLIYAGGKFNHNKYQVFNADKDNILPILQGAYFEDDIVSRFIEFVQITFGEEVLTENLDFIANTLGKKKGETAKETIRRYFLNEFFKDHVQTYKKRPIYWLFTSGKQKAFNCLIYVHRYDKTTLSRIRTDYLHECQIRLDAEKKDLQSIIEGDYSTKEISNAKKELKALDKKIEELKEYDEVLHHMADMQIDVDLDDGVVVNYEKFKGLVSKT